MMRRPLRPLAPTLWLSAALAACASSPSGNAADAAATDAPATDAPATDAPATDAPPAGDGGACADFTGGYALTGTCSVPGFSPFPTACVAQTGCSAQVTLDGNTVPGMVSGDRLTFASSVGGVPLSCTATRNADATLAVRCEAAGGAATCDAVAAVPSFPGATRWCCNPGAQDCGAGQRCNIVGVGAGNNTAFTACVPAGATAAGASCTRAEGRLGADDCAAGLTCANYGQAMATQRTCSRACATGAECGAGEVCIVVTSTPRAGVCRPSCAPSDATACAAGTCRYFDGVRSGSAGVVRVATCQPIGGTAEGMPCMSNLDCAAGLACARRTAADAFTCRPVCDQGRPCAAGTCSGMMSDTNPAAEGVCFP